MGVGVGVGVGVKVAVGVGVGIAGAFNTPKVPGVAVAVTVVF